MAAADFQIEDGDGRVTLRLIGDWTATELGRISRRLDDTLHQRCVDAVDLSALGRFDTAGALAIVQASNCVLPETAWKQRPEAGRTYALVERLERESAEPPRRPPGWVRGFAKVGRGVHDIAAEATLSMAFLGRLITATGSTFKHWDKVRWAAWFSQAERAGLDAIPIVAVTSFFIGAVIAFIGADLLRTVGFDVFAVELVSISVLREFAVVIAAVLLAGRSSSSFAAEIGSMRMNQEVDAMQVMGVNPFQALVIPRLAALVVMLPLLTFIAMLTGIFGGLLVTWTELGLGPSFFIQRMATTADMGNHLFVGLSKAPVFALVIAAIGCRQGMAVAGDVESLGRRVTAAVVQAIFAIIFLDAVFALMFMELGV